MKLVLGTRGSALALAQSNHMRRRLLDHPDVDEVELRIIKTRGDKILDVALSAVGGKGLFVKELEVALLERDVDLAVHSLKDMPSELPDGLCLAAIPEREDPRDAWVRPEGAPDVGVSDLPQGAVVGTSSLRRQAQLLATRPDLTVVPLRGNVDTRLRKLDDGVDDMAAIVLACAGLVRLGHASRITRAFDPSVMLPAVGQGALVIEGRTHDDVVGPILASLDSPATRVAVEAERALLEHLQGGCTVPVGGFATLDGDRLSLEGLIATTDGATVLRERLDGPASDPVALGVAVAERLVAAGGRLILDALRDA